MPIALMLLVLATAGVPTSAPAHLNADVLITLAEIPDGDHGPYAWPSTPGTHGTTRDLYLGRHRIARQGKGTYCVGITFEVLWRTLERQPGGLTATGLTVAEARRLLRLWFVPRNNGRGPAEALPALRLGHAVPSLDQALPGDFVQFWGQGWGHSAVFLGWIRNRQGSITGMKFWSSQVWTQGIGKAAMVVGPQRGAIDPSRIYLGRLMGRKHRPGGHPNQPAM